MQKIANNIYLISPKQIPVYPYSNSLWIDDSYSTIIDFGAGVQAYNNIDKEKLVYGLFSHAHFDHMHCNSLFPNAIFMASAAEEKIYQEKDSYEENFGYNLWDEIMPEYFPRPPFNLIRATDNTVLVKPGFRYIEIGDILYDKKLINTGKIDIQAIHLPGHSAGHFGFYLEKDNILFSGDLDLVASGPLYNNFTSDIGSLLASIDKIREINPRIIVSSHRRLQEDRLQEKLKRYKKVVTDRNEILYNFLSTPKSIEEIYHLSFWDTKDVYDVFWNRMTINNHIKYLLSENLILKINKYYSKK